MPRASQQVRITNETSLCSGKRRKSNVEVDTTVASVNKDGAETSFELGATKSVITKRKKGENTQ